MPMNKAATAYYLLAIANGTLMVAYGGHDDSPGAQMLGALLIIFTIIAMFKRMKKR